MLADMSNLISRARFVVNQKAKIIEMVNEYAIRDPEGTEIGVIRQEGQSTLKKLARFVSSLDQFMTHTLAVYDADGSKVLTVTRPRKFMKSTLLVDDASGQNVGSIVQRNVVGKIRFGLLDTHGGDLGEIRAENWRAWDFAIVDTTGNEVGRITKTWEGLAKTLFTTADNYLIELSDVLSGPARVLAFASGVAVDTALKQDARGLG
jgi:uncharacterized protein YxjI